MGKPDYLAQTGEIDRQSDSWGRESRAWIDKRFTEAKAEGCKCGRVSFDETHGLLLVEAWKERQDDQGEPRFQLTIAREAGDQS